MHAWGAGAQTMVRHGWLLLVVLALFAWGTGGASAAPPLASEDLGVHSMLYLDHPFSAKEAMFREAAALGASTIRLDISLSGVFPEPNAPPDWSGVNQYMLLARRYHLEVLADLQATPYYMVACPSGTPDDETYICPPSDPEQWGDLAGQIAAHTRGVIDDFEIINEPDGAWAFLGSPQQYARILAASYDAIHAADPNARVALGGLGNIGSGGKAWMDTMLSTPGEGASDKFDIANIHVRTPAAEAGAVVSRWLRYFAVKGFNGPLWVTETGYPADPFQQTDPAYQGGADAQARWLTTVIPAVIRAGAAKVFVTERDQQAGRYASEGVLQTSDPLTADPSYRRRQSFYAVRDLVTSGALVAETTLQRLGGLNSPVAVGATRGVAAKPALAGIEEVVHRYVAASRSPFHNRHP